MAVICHQDLFVLLLLVLPSMVISDTSETALIRHLMKKQSPSARPVIRRNDTIYVKFGLELVHIASVIEYKQTIGVKVWLRMSWNNELMRWRPQEWSNITVTRANPDAIWTPDLFLVEDISSSISAGPKQYKTQVVMDYNGTHNWYVPALLDSSCRFDVQNFPFDHQFCAFKFMSWTYDQTELDIKADTNAIVTGYYINSSEWDLHHVTRTITPQMYNCCPNPYVHIKYVIELRRKPLYYAYNVIVPCIIQMTIILFTFFLPPESGERIGVAITVLLVFAVYLEVLSTSLPKTSVSAPALSRFYLAAMAGSAFSIIATCFVLVIHFKGAEKGVHPMPRWVKRLFLRCFGKAFCIKMNLRQHDDHRLLALQREKIPSWNVEEAPLRNGGNGLTEMIGKISVGERYSGQYKKTPTEHEKTMGQLVDEVRVITELIHDQNLQDEIEEEWQTLSKVFDRIFFFTFLTYFMTSSLVVLLPIYKAHASGQYEKS